MRDLLEKCKSEESRERLANLLFKDLIEIDELQNMLEVSYEATGMPSGIIDAITGEVYAGAGWQRICTHFHRTTPETISRCIASDTAITNKIKNGTHFGYKCANGLWDIGVPIMCHGKHIATFFLGQFFYEDEIPEIDFFIDQADRFNFDKAGYLSALEEVPRFSKAKVDATLKYNIALSAFLSNLASQYMTLQFEIEQRKEAEQEICTLRNYLANVIDSMPSTLIGVDAESRITQWNKNAQQVTGIGSKQAMGRPLMEVMPEMETEVWRIKEAIFNSGMQNYTAISNYDDSSIRYNDVTIYPLIANGAKGAVIRIDDVTERINLERAIVQSEKMMSIGGLAAGMAHEINNPLAGIIGHTSNIHNRIYSDIPANRKIADKCSVSLADVRSYLDAREIPRMLNGIKDAGVRAASIVSNMLTFARKSESNSAPQDLSELIDRTIELAESDYNLKKQYDFKQIRIERDYTPLPRKVTCEGNEIRQVLLNIFKNGAEAMSEKQYSDTEPMFLCRVFEENNMAVMSIEDNGPGMDESTRRRIFEPFFTTKDVDKGTGLGLSISYFIITEQHGGIMEVDSRPGRWTRFTIKLPYERSI